MTDILGKAAETDDLADELAVQETDDAVVLAPVAAQETHGVEIQAELARELERHGADDHIGSREVRPKLVFSRSSFLLLAADALALLAPLPWSSSHIRATLSLAVLSVVVLQMGGFYRSRLHAAFLDDLPGITGRMMASAGFVATIAALRHPGPYQVRDLVFSAGESAVLLLTARAIANSIIGFCRRRGVWARKVLVVGGGSASMELMDTLTHWPEHGLQVIGYLDDDLAQTVPSIWPHFGVVGDLPEVLARTGADVVIIGRGTFCESNLNELVAKPAVSARDIYIVNRELATHVSSGSRDHIGAIPVTRLCPANRRLFSLALKRAMDISVSIVGLVLASPILLFSGLAMRLETGPGVIFRQIRIGRHGQPFEVLKLKTMRPVPKAMSDTTWHVTDRDRLGPVGRFLRRTSLDELPQLWNILRGDMSLVGPRPERPVFVDKFSAEHPRYPARHRVSVGLTGLAQVSGLRGDTSIADRVRHDNYYIENWTLWLDVKVLLRTLREVVAGGER